jgi:hypothetical protein
LAVKEKADFIIGETFGTFGESKIALESILQYAPGKNIALACRSFGCLN